MNDWQSEYAEIASLAGGFAHEIRNPLSTILLNVDLLAEDLADPQSPRERRMATKLDRVRLQCQNLERVVESFLQFSRVGQTDAAPGDLAVVITDYLDEVEAETAAAGVELSPHIAPDLPSVWLDAGLFRQVLSNLVRNARQAMPGGGTLEVGARSVQNEVLVEVIDNGCGMTPEQRNRMFEAFYSTKTGGTDGASGTGLGLPTVRKIVEAHGGRIDCESEPGRGTRFRIWLPAVAPSDSSAHQPANDHSHQKSDSATS